MGTVSAHYGHRVWMGCPKATTGGSTRGRNPADYQFCYPNCQSVSTNNEGYFRPRRSRSGGQDLRVAMVWAGVFGGLGGMMGKTGKGS